VRVESGLSSAIYCGDSPAGDSRVICENLGMRPRIRTEICPRSDLSFAAKWGQLETRTSAASLPHSAEIYSVGLNRGRPLRRRDGPTDDSPAGSCSPLRDSATPYYEKERKRKRGIFLDSKIKLFIDVS